MSNLTPLVFPEGQRSPTSHASSAFPYRSIDSAPSTQTSASASINRMQQLENMLKEVQGRAEIVEKEAYDKAYLAGEKAGMVLGRKRGEQILESLQETLKETESSLLNIQQCFAEAAMDVAKHVAESIVGKSIKTDPNRLLDMTKQAADQLPDSSSLRIAISPGDYSRFQRLLEDEHSMLSLKRDATVKNGTCRLITNQQDILIDPIAAVNDYINTLRPALLDPSNPNNNDE